MVCHALRILALRYSDDFRWHHKLFLLYYLEISDNIYSSLRGNQSEFVELFIFEELVGNLYDALLAVDLAGKVDAYRDLAFHSLEVEDVKSLIYILCRYMVQYGTIFPSGMACPYGSGFSDGRKACVLRESYGTYNG